MKRIIGLRGTAASLLMATAVGGCGSSPDETGQGPRKLEVYSWLTSGSERMALDNLFGVITAADPEIKITNAAQDRSDIARMELPTRMAANNPPDSFQAIGGADLAEWIGKGSLEPIDSLAAEQGWESVFPKAVLDLVRGPDGLLYGVPLNVERDNTLFYNKEVFAAAGLTDADLPTTVDGFFAAAEKLKAQGVTPLAMSASGGWTIASHVFEAVLVAEGGPQFYLDYMTGKKTADDPIIQQTVTDVARMLDYANDDRATTGWSDAVGKVCRGEAAMLFLPDFTKGEFQNKGCGTADKPNIGYVSMQPPNQPTFVFVGITFPLPKGAPHRDVALEFLRVVGSKAGQEAFNPIKGSIATRTDIDKSKFDAISQQTAIDFAAADETLVPGYAALTSSDYQEKVNPALQAFVDRSNVAFKDSNELLSVLRQNYSIIKP